MDAPKLDPKESLKASFPKLNQAIDNANEALNKITIGFPYLNGTILSQFYSTPTRLSIDTKSQTIKNTSNNPVYVATNKGHVEIKNLPFSYTNTNPTILIFVDAATGDLIVYETQTDFTKIPDNKNLILLGAINNEKMYHTDNLDSWVINGVSNGGWRVSNDSLSDNYFLGSVRGGNIVIDTTEKTIKFTGNIIFYNNYWGNTSTQTINIENINTGIFVFYNLTTSQFEVYEGRTNVPKNPNLILLGIYYLGKVYNALTRESFIVNGIPDGGWYVEPPVIIHDERYTFVKTYKDWMDGKKSPIVFLSDSTTDGDTTTDHTNNIIGTDHKDPNTYTTKLESLLRGETKNSILRIYNAGFSGKQADWALDNIEGIMSPYSDAKIIVIGYGINDRRTNYREYYDTFYTNIENLINWCFNNSYQPALMTTQAILDIGMDTSSDKSRSAESVNTIANQVKKELANKYNLELIDVNELTSMFLNYSSYTRSQIIPDRLHFSDVGHLYEAGMFFAHFVPRVQWIKDSQQYLITLVDQKSKTDVIGSTNLTSSSGKFKEILNFSRAETTEIILQDAWIFNGTRNKVNIVGYGNADVYINDTLYPTSEGKTESIELELGLHHLVAKTSSTEVYWEGFEVI